jgi:hypothetical protein
MISTTARAFGQSLVALAAVALFSACAADGSVAPTPRSLVASSGAPGADLRAVDLGNCPEIQVPEGSKLAFHAYAAGVQIYQWNGAAWILKAPEADLFVDADGKGKIGTHFRTADGPTWLTVSGSQVTGTNAIRCPVGPTTIPWLRLDATSEGTGVFENTKFIQRLNTVGGTAPVEDGTFVGQETREPYTAEYFFYRAP